MATLGTFKTGTGKNNVPPGLLNPSAYVQVASLTADTEASVTLPSDVDYVIFSAEDDFFATTDADVLNASVAPLAAVTDGSGPFLNPTGFHLPEDGSITTIYLRARTAINVVVYCYKKGGE